MSGAAGATAGAGSLISQTSDSFSELRYLLEAPYIEPKKTIIWHNS